jgi:CDGSH-type Zn-finger protein
LMDTSKDKANKTESEKQRIKVSKNGPYVVSGNIPLFTLIIVTDAAGDPNQWCAGKKYPTRQRYALCRCGESKSEPFCDGTHAKINFDGTETASKERYIKRAKRYDGPSLVLADEEGLCARTRFCRRAGGVWDLVQKSKDKKARATAIEEVANCPSGRLTLWDKKTGDPIEPKLERSIALIEGPKPGELGPIWVRGGIPIESADDKTYEIRNRITLCRCGKSSNKPFCDGRHFFE